MSATIARDLQITWGSFVIGGTSDYMIHGVYNVVYAFDRMSFTVDIAISQDDLATFADRCRTLEAEFRKRDQRLIVAIDSEPFIDRDPGSAGIYTALNTKATITKGGTIEADTQRSRLYTVTFEMGLPADDEQGDPPTAGLREMRITLTYTPARQRQISFQGTCTAYDTNTAYDQYEASKAAWVKPWLDLMKGQGPWELTDENVAPDLHNEVADFGLNYVEVIYAQSQSALDDARIVSHVLQFSDQTQAPGDSSSTIVRLHRIVAAWECWVSRDVETPDPVDLKRIYEEVVLPHIKAEFVTEFGATDFGIEDHRRTFDHTLCRITASITFLANIEATNVVETTISQGFRESRNIDYTWIWDGGELDAYADQGHARIIRVTNRVAVVLGVVSPQRRIGQGGGSFFGIGGSDPNANPESGLLRPSEGETVAPSGWNMIGNDSDVTPLWVGEGDERISFTRLVETVSEMMNESPTGGRGTGGTLMPGPGGGVFGIDR